MADSGSERHDTPAADGRGLRLVDRRLRFPVAEAPTPARLIREIKDPITTVPGAAADSGRSLDAETVVRAVAAMPQNVVIGPWLGRRIVRERLARTWFWLAILCVTVALLVAGVAA